MFQTPRRCRPYLTLCDDQPQRCRINGIGFEGRVGAAWPSVGLLPPVRIVLGTVPNAMSQSLVEQHSMLDLRG
jgi:hypothetical protein